MHIMLSDGHNLVFETLEPDKGDSVTPPLAVSEFVIAATQPLQSN